MSATTELLINIAAVNLEANTALLQPVHLEILPLSQLYTVDVQSHKLLNRSIDIERPNLVAVDDVIPSLLVQIAEGAGNLIGVVGSPAALGHNVAIGAVDDSGEERIIVYINGDLIPLGFGSGIVDIRQTFAPVKHIRRNFGNTNRNRYTF